MLVALTNEQKVLVTLDPRTEAGNVATLDGTPTWEVVSGDVTVEVAEDGLSAYIISGEPSTELSVVRVSADADLDEEVRTLTSDIQVAVVAAEAGTLGLVAGEPELK